jgi:Carboxypeptidase regulatory-like domain/TonB dependent receptor-like, beta-barrel
MCSRVRLSYSRSGHLLAFALCLLGLANPLHGQTASTGAITGITIDPSRAALPHVTVHLMNIATGKTRSTTSGDDGTFNILLLSPGNYDLRAEKPAFDPVTLKGLRVSVTETLRVRLALHLRKNIEKVIVHSGSTTVQTDSSSVGQIVTGETITGVPLVTRNFSQIVGLSPGVITGVYNAGELGIGGTALSQISPSNDGLYVHGGRSYDNNWHLDGISVSDVLGSSSASGGIPIPNPDTIEEFKVQTGLYDAAFGRAAGSNISVITKQGGNNYHGSVFEFLRNDVLNANDFFLNQVGQPRPPLKQNQFGFTFGGPILKNKLFFFSSYQGTRQVNGVAAGQPRVACTASLHEPPLTDDRSPAALGALFGGMQGALGGVAVSPDGSNINPAALALLNLKLPNGQFLIPTPQTISTSRPFASQGFTVLSEPCHFSEDQLLANFDYNPSQQNHFAARVFIANSDQSVTFPGNGLNATGNIPGFSSPADSAFVVVSLSHTIVLSSGGLNEARLGFVRTASQTAAHAPFAWSDIGATEGDLNRQNELPSLLILGSISMAPAFPRTYIQNRLSFSDVFSWVKGAHAIRVGGSIARLQDPLNFGGFNSFLEFLGWPDFLLGLSAAGNGTGTFSNVFESADAFGLFHREFRAWEISGFAQDDYRITKRLTLNLGLRYERPGQFGDQLGRNSSFDPSKADTNPPASGSLDGNLVASNFPGALPPGVERVKNTTGTYGDGQNTIAPRFGFAWQVLPRTTRLALRGGYGIYYSRPTGQAYTASVLAAPFGLVRTSVGLANSGASFQEPFAQPFPTSGSFPMFLPYSATTNSSVNVLAPNFRPAMAQQFSLNVQAEPKAGWLLTIGYFGVRGLHLQRFRSLNQALDASPDNPVNGVTSNTLANIALRVPIPGIRPDALRELESEGSSWYNGLESSLAKQMGHGLQFLVSYTFSKTLDTDGANINGTSGVNTLTLGDQNSPHQRWGRASFDRTHRFVFSETWALPSPTAGARRAFLGGWNLAAIATIQSGSALTIGNTNADNVFGISEDRAQLSGTCSNGQLVNHGGIESKLNAYFNVACFANPPIIGADGKGTAFGNSGTGIVDGPGQANLDLAVSKAMPLSWPHDGTVLELRAEFFNALNHPQFANPDTNFASPTFGIISSTAVNPRVGQVALRFSF